MPIAFLAGSITSFSQFAVKTTGNFLCPSGTTPESYSYESTTTDEYGNSQPATAVELHCVDQNGAIVKNDPVVYSFLWIGVFALIGFMISGTLAFVLAAPAGLLIAKLLNRRQKSDTPSTIDVL